MILPLITVPYVSRVLMPKGVGTFAYTASIASYFALLGMLGIGTYGNKVIAMSRDNQIKMSENFFGIFILQLMLTMISTIGYLIFVIFFIREDRNIALIQTVGLFGTVIDCSWFFFGIEMFKKIVLRNISIKLLSLAAVFLFVKDQNDLGVYTLIMCLSGFAGSLVMWFYLRRHIVPVKLSVRSVLKHVKPTFVYFLPQVAIQVYFVLDKTMLGLLSNKSEVGIYDYADKIRMMGLSVVTSLGTVMLPRMAHTFSIGQIEKAKDYLAKSLDFSTLLAVPLMFGLAGISKEFIPWYMGNRFLECISVLIILSPTIVLMSWSGVFGTQYLVPIGRMRAYTASLFLGAITNFVINLIVIKAYGSIGASIGTVGAELVVTIMQLYFVRNVICLKTILLKTSFYLSTGLVMYLFVRLIGRNLGISIQTTVIQITAGTIFYISVVVIVAYLRRNGVIYSEMTKLLWRIQRGK